MSKEEYLKELSEKIGCLSHDEYSNIMEYYTEYLEDAGEGYEETMKNLGTPEELAERIINDSGNRQSGQYDEKNQGVYPQGQPYQGGGSRPSGLSTGWKIVILILTSPIWLGFAGGVIGIVAGLFAGGLACIASSVAVIVAGFAVISSSAPTTILFLGVAFVVAAVGLGLLLGCMAIVHLIVKLIRYIFAKKNNVM